MKLIIVNAVLWAGMLTCALIITQSPPWVGKQDIVKYTIGWNCALIQCKEREVLSYSVKDTVLACICGEPKDSSK